MALPADAATINVGADCSLVDAIESANTETGVNMCEQGAGADIIILPAAYSLSLNAGNYLYTSLAGYAYYSALPTINSEITIQGSGGSDAIIERAGTTDDFRLLAVEAYSSLTLESITLRGGQLTGPNSSGAGIYAKDASLTIVNSTISGNSANVGGGIALQNCAYFMMNASTVSDNSVSNAGGGIYAFYPATISITNSSVSANRSGSFGAGIAVVGDTSNVDISGGFIADNVADPASEYGLGGGIYVFDAILNISEVSISNNSAYIGGGLHADDSIVEIEKSTLSENTALFGGAGVYLADASIDIIKTTISTNITDSQGGGVFHSGGIGSSFKLRDSTLSGNLGAIGSALYLAAETKEIRSSTIYHNSASGSGIDAASVVSIGPPDVIVNTIIAGSNTADCYFGVGLPTIVNNSSWFADASCDGAGQGRPLLNPLANNNQGLANSTLTHAPSLGSAVLGIGDTGVCALYGASDQRGAPRGVVSCDIGAVEGGIEGEFETSCFVLKASNDNVINFCL